MKPALSIISPRPVPPAQWLHLAAVGHADCERHEPSIAALPNRRRCNIPRRQWGGAAPRPSTAAANRQVIVGLPCPRLGARTRRLTVSRAAIESPEACAGPSARRSLCPARNARDARPLDVPCVAVARDRDPARRCSSRSPARAGPGRQAARTLHPRGALPPRPEDLPYCADRWRGEAWLALAFDGATGWLYDRQEKRILGGVAHIARFNAVQQTDRERMLEIRDRIDRKIREQLHPKDLFYQILDGLRSLTRYDHSSALLIRDGTGSMEDLPPNRSPGPRPKAADRRTATAHSVPSSPWQPARPTVPSRSACAITAPASLPRSRQAVSAILHDQADGEGTGVPPVWAAFRGSAGSGTVLFCGSGDEKCPQVQLWAQVRENGGDTGRGLKR